MTKNIIAVDNGLSNDTLKIEYVFGNVCNYKCWYCFPGSNEGTHRWPDIELIKRNLGHLIKQYIRYGKKKIQLNIIGGEPTMWPKLGDFAEYFFKEFGCLVSMSTNGSRTLRWWEENAKYFGYIDLSVHHDEAKLNHLIDVADCVYDQNVYLAAKVLMDFKNWDHCITAIETLKTSKRKWYIAAKDIHINGQWFYTPEQKEFLSKPVKRYPEINHFLKNYKIDNTRYSVTFEDGVSQKVPSCYFALNNLNHFKGWECTAGVDWLHISREGDILCTMMQPLYQEEKIYNIYQTDFTEVFNPTIAPVICTKDDCFCNAEITLKKRKIISIVQQT